jgi:hypothetical protein
MSDKNTFVVDKFQKYLEGTLKNIEYVENEPQESKIPLKIPKITRKDQIYWICEDCGISNPYFLPRCKNCKQERPNILYESYENVNFLKNNIQAKKPISQVITEEWQTIDEIAYKMGLIIPENILELHNKLKHLTQVNYLISDKTSMRFKINTYKID